MASPAGSFDRLEAELSLLEAMYPSCIAFNSRSREVHYKSSTHSSADLTLRLPDYYPEAGVPSLISARDASKDDIRDQTKRAIDSLSLTGGEETLDQIISAFEDVATGAQAQQRDAAPAESTTTTSVQPFEPSSKTVIIWLHHLLATSKRKLAITPTTTSASSNRNTTQTEPTISGMTKPGYPGIMIFSGTSSLVDAHVRELKNLNWQAFQVRYDSSEDVPESGQESRQWDFAHGRGKIVEVESMAEVVKGIVREEHRELFLKSVGVK